MKRFLAYDGINCEHEEFDDIKDAEKYLEELFLDRDGDEGYHPDAESCYIFELKEVVKIDVVAKKSEMSEEEWNNKYSEDNKFGEIWQHRFELANTDIAKGQSPLP